MQLHTYSSNSDGNKWSSSEHGSNSIAAAMSMAAKGTHYFPYTLARHNFCIFFRFVNSTFSEEYNCRKQRALVGFNPVQKGTWRSWPFRSVRLCRPDFLECAPGVPGSRKDWRDCTRGQKVTVLFVYVTAFIIIYLFYVFFILLLFILRFLFILRCLLCVHFI